MLRLRIAVDTSLSRISQVEQKIDGIVASLVNPNGAQPTPAPAEPSVLPAAGNASTPKTSSPVRPAGPGSWSAPGSWLPFSSLFAREPSPPEHDAETSQRDAEPTHQFLEKLRVIHNFGDDTDLTRPPDAVFQSTARLEPPIDDDVVKGLLSNGEAEALLIEYRSMSKSFPFVPVPSSVTAQELSVMKPMLFLAIVTVSSWKDHKRQMALDVQYRKELANRTIIHPRRTLSLVQSVLVYLSW